MNRNKVTAGIAIIAGALAIPFPVWGSTIALCSSNQNYNIHPDYLGPPTNCDMSLRGYFTAFLLWVIPIIGIGTWLLIFGLKEISLIAFKKVSS